jgi:hypothetical protein
MNKHFLLNKGIEFVEEAEFGIDEISNSGFDSIEDFLFDWCFHFAEVGDFKRRDIKYYIVSGENKRIRVVVWLEN